MASFAGAFAASHGPLIIREWQRVPVEQQRRMSAAYRELGRRLTAIGRVRMCPECWDCSSSRPK